MTESHEAPIGDRVNSRNLIVGCGKYGCSTVVLHGDGMFAPLWLPFWGALFIPLFTSPIHSTVYLTYNWIIYLHFKFLSSHLALKCMDG